MVKVRLIHADNTDSSAVVLIPERHLPQLLRQGDRLYTRCYIESGRLVFKETECLDAFTEEEYERAKQEGLLT